MGCDYYIIVALIVKYNRDNEVDICFIKVDRLKMYLMFKYNCDANEEDYIRLANREIEYVGNVYSNMDRIVYENNKWNVDNKTVINEYYAYLANKGISLDCVINIERKHLKMKKQLIKREPNRIT